MSTSRAVTPVCLVIRWSKSVTAASGPALLLRRLVEDHLPATWGVETREQTELFAAVSSTFVETAIWLPKVKAPTVGDAIADGLHRLSTADREVTTLCIDGELPRGQIERQLAQQGVRAIVTSAPAPQESPNIRPLPFGIAQLSPTGTLPSQRRWFRRVGGVPQDFFAVIAGPTIVSIDAGRVGEPESPTWKELEKAIDQAATACDRGRIRLTTIADLSLELAEKSSPKPQRSILRAA